MEKITIIGAGIAGLCAAICLAEKEIACRLVSSQASERAQSVLAEGGINAALNIMGEEDTPKEHFADTIKGGVFLADPNAVRGLTEGAPEIVRWLRRIGVPFQMEGGKMIQRNFGGQKKKRTAYAKSSTGKVLVNALIDEARKYEAAGLVERFSHHDFLELILENDGHRKADAAKCCGVIVKDRYSGRLYAFTGPVICCFGGFGGLFPGMSTGTTQNTGDALAMAFSQGLALANLEFVQYHPTTVAIAGKRLLVSEAARGEGGRLFVNRNGGKWYFMEEKYPELKNLMPRDVISREMTAVVKEPGCESQVYLDLTGLPESTWATRLPDLRAQIIRYLGLDPVRDYVPVSPGIHYFMGGIYTDEGHRTNIKSLYAAGECACQYHGANRLGGNSLLGACYGGRIAAKSAAADLSGKVSSSADEALKEAQAADERGEYAVSPRLAQELGSILSSCMAIVRDEESLAEGEERVRGLAESAKTRAEKNRCLVGLALIKAARARKESRGSHTRSDYPERDDEGFRKTTVIRVREGEPETELVPLPRDREE